jgi:hypothetical protein
MKSRLHVGLVSPQSTRPPATPRVSDDLTAREQRACVNHTGLDVAQLAQAQIKSVTLGELTLVVEGKLSVDSSASFILAEYIREQGAKMVRGLRVAAQHPVTGLAAALSGAACSVIIFDKDCVGVSLAHASIALSDPWLSGVVHVAVDESAQAISSAFGPFDVVLISDIIENESTAMRAAVLARGTSGARIILAHRLVKKADLCNFVDERLRDFVAALAQSGWTIASPPQVLTKTQAVRLLGRGDWDYVRARDSAASASCLNPPILPHLILPSGLQHRAKSVALKDMHHVAQNRQLVR